MKNKTLLRTYKMSKSHIKTIMLVVVVSLVITALELINPYLIKIVIDDYISVGIYEKGKITVQMIGMAYLFIAAMICILDFINSCITEYVGQKVVFDLRNKLFKYTQYANTTFHDKTPTGKLFVRIANDAEDISALFKDVISTIIKDVIIIIAIISMMLYLNVKLSLISFVVIPFIVVTSYFITRALNKAYTHSKSIRTRLNTFLAESIYGIKLIKIFNRQIEKQHECEKTSKEFFNSRKITGIYEGLLPAIIDVLQDVAIIIIVGACVNKWFSIESDVGLIYIFIIYIKKLFEPITRIMDNIEVVQDSFVSINKIYDILEKEEYVEDLDTGKYVCEFKGKIEFKNVWFSYDKENYVLKDISFTIHPHESVALVGKTGSGKTTITNLINRFYDIDKGKILIDGINIKDINLKCLRKNVGVILQDPYIFARNIKDNIKLNADISDKVVESSLKLSSANNFINKLPGKFEYIASQRGESFSVGEKQLIAFSRIFAHNPSIFILDEATANIDTNTERVIQKSVDIISKEKTSVFIAHRLSTIVNVDKIFVLNQGRIIESGNHNQLLKSNGYYSSLYNSYYTTLAKLDK
ncbi:MAG: ABC transporter ATP-binding protein/permease [Clostridia bacterium]|nr:ABC transporter ATP-binding protein/permease [Clostridia bacterium]